MLTQEYLKSVLSYDPETGIFTWKYRQGLIGKKISWNTRYSEKQAGTIDPVGYLGIAIEYKRYYAHRLAWLYMTGELPKKYIDHLNGNKSDNRFLNLREATNSENQQNQKRAKTSNISGFLGVSLTKEKNKYRSRIVTKGKQIVIGIFDTPEEAHEKYLEAKRKLHLFNTI